MEGYIQQAYEGATRRYVQTLELRDAPDMIAQYRLWHSEGKVWQEILDGIREVGLLEMEIYLLGTRLVMIVDAPADLDWQQAMDRLATLPRQAEWEAFVARLQGCRPDARSDEKWQPMERIFHLYK